MDYKQLATFTGNGSNVSSLLFKSNLVGHYLVFSLCRVLSCVNTFIDIMQNEFMQFILSNFVSFLSHQTFQTKFSQERKECFQENEIEHFYISRNSNLHFWGKLNVFFTIAISVIFTLFSRSFLQTSSSNYVYSMKHPTPPPAPTTEHTFEQPQWK